ncbi:UNVERIFIED_CONTAM: hypothetical protein Slati_0915200 [Sesamum latifolium]|uniref:Uncharacterized protein n=1 Tax=Sesamum latifolium TaxID=2727402 RepID=A0AAW2XVH1_9LAMI
MVFKENGDVESESEHESSDDEQVEETIPEHGELLVVRRALNMQMKVDDAEQQKGEHLSYKMFSSREATTKLSNPYKLQWLNDCGEIQDDVLCDVVPMHASHILWGRPWKFDRRVTYDGFLNRYTLKHQDQNIQLVSLNPQQV